MTSATRVSAAAVGTAGTAVGLTGMLGGSMATAAGGADGCAGATMGGASAIAGCGLALLGSVAAGGGDGSGGATLGAGAAVAVGGALGPPAASFCSSRLTSAVGRRWPRVFATLSARRASASALSTSPFNSYASARYSYASLWARTCLGSNRIASPKSAMALSASPLPR